MTPESDSELLGRFVEQRSDTAFAGLVERHVNLVYSVAVRQVQNTHEAEEITQAVFIILARKAGELRHGRALSSWLFQTTRRTANNSLRAEFRRQRREQEAYMQSTLNEPADDAWLQISPWLDGAVENLGEADRQAIMLRFYEKQDLQTVGTSLGISEAAAGKRVSRALEKLRKLFAKRGVTLSTAAIAGAVSAGSVEAAPLGLAAKITVAALAGTTAATTATLIATTKTIAMTTLQKITVTAALAATIGAGIYEAKQAHDEQSAVTQLQAERTPLTNDLARLQLDNQQLSNQLAEVKNQQRLTQSQFNELLKLRGQAGQSQTAVQELAKARAALKSQPPAMMGGFFTNAMAMGLKTSLASQKKSAAARIAHMKQALNLSDAQAQAITDITFRHLEDQSQKLMQAMASGDLTAEISSDNVSLQAANGGSSVATQEDEIKAQLTPDQLAAYDAFKKAEAEADKERSAKAKADRMTEELSLTPDQQQQVHDLLLQDAASKNTPLTQAQTEALAAAHKSGDYATIMQLSLQQEQQRFTNQVNLFQTVLTPQQLQQYQASEQQQLEMMKDAFGMFLPQTNTASAH